MGTRASRQLQLDIGATAWLAWLRLMLPCVYWRRKLKDLVIASAEAVWSDIFRLNMWCIMKISRIAPKRQAIEPPGLPKTALTSHHSFSVPRDAWVLRGPFGYDVRMLRNTACHGMLQEGEKKAPGCECKHSTGSLSWKMLSSRTRYVISGSSGVKNAATHARGQYFVFQMADLSSEPQSTCSGHSASHC